MTISVLVPTYRRPQDLHRCLEAMKKQSRPADEIIVIHREGDEETKSFLRNYQYQPLPLKIAKVEVTGVIAAMNAGLAVIDADIVALIDDDAAPFPDWLQRIESHFLSDSQIAGVGGRDVLVGLEGASDDVGKLKWWGQVSGNHHIGVGEAREVDVLKGVNCAYRSVLLRRIGFDTRMRGKGAQVHWELSLGFTLRRQGWKLIYDPSVAVEHFPAARHDEDQRSFSPVALFDIVHNETLVLLEHLSWPQKVIFLLWVSLIGIRAAPGLFQVPRLILKRDRNVFRKWMVTTSGRIAGIRSFLVRPKG